jgi:co-chaperonin GroES (HSP10)
MTQVTQLNPFADFDNPSDLDVSKLVLPNPVGHNLLVLPLKFEAKTKGGLIMSSGTRDLLQERITVGYVLATGPMAYRHNPKYFGEPDTEAWAPWCKVGDWVIFNKLGNGTKLEFNGIHYWMLADTQVLATVDDPKLTYPEFTFAGFDTGKDDNYDPIPLSF